MPRPLIGHGLGEGDSAAAENQLTGGGERGYGRGVTHPLLDRLIVLADAAQSGQPRHG